MPRERSASSSLRAPLKLYFGALLAPSALALLSTTFVDADERSKAFGVFSATAASGASIVLLVSGALTEWLSWRWCFYVNLLFAVPAVLLALRLVVNEALGIRQPVDLLAR